LQLKTLHSGSDGQAIAPILAIASEIAHTCRIANKAADRPLGFASAPESNSQGHANAEPIRLRQPLRNSAYLATFWQRSGFGLFSQSLAVNSGYALTADHFFVNLARS
jgi:hypothetical protein